MEQTEVKLQINDDLKQKAWTELCRRATVTVQANSIRDEILRSYADQVDGVSQPVGTGPWAGSCQLEDPMTQEHVTQLVAYLMASLRSEPYVLIEAQSPGDEEGAKNLEQALTIKAQQWGLKMSLNDAVTNAVSYPYAPCRVTWEEDLVKTRYMAEVDAETGEEIDPEQAQIAAQPDPNAQPGDDLGEPVQGPVTRQQSKVKWEVQSAGPKMTAILPDDIYLYPPNCQDLDKCEQIFERVRLTRSDLYAGIKKYGYDEDEVTELLRHGPTGYIANDDITSTADMADGQEPDQQDGIYECFICTGQFPLLFEDGKCITPDYLQDEEFCWLLVPDYQIAFRWTPVNERPYFVYHINRKPGRMLGRCVPQFLETLQAEATANLRFKIDIANLVASPMLKVKRSWNEDHQGWETFPGAKIEVDGLDDVVPFEWDKSGVEILTAQQMEILNRADKLMSAPGIEQMTPSGQGVPTATQTNMVGQGLTLKRDLFLQTFQEGTEKMFQFMVSLWLQHMGEDGETVLAKSSEVKVTKDDLAKKYRFIPHANSDAANPAIRIQMVQQKQAAQMQYLTSMMQMPPDKWPMLYHGARRALEEMNERNVEAWIGKEPAGVDPMQILGEVANAAATLAEQGDPGAMMILQLLSELTQGAMSGAGAPAQAPNAQQGGPQGASPNGPPQQQPQQMANPQGFGNQQQKQAA